MLIKSWYNLKIALVTQQKKKKKEKGRNKEERENWQRTANLKEKKGKEAVEKEVLVWKTNNQSFHYRGNKSTEQQHKHRWEGNDWFVQQDAS